MWYECWLLPAYVTLGTAKTLLCKTHLHGMSCCFKSSFKKIVKQLINFNKSWLMAKLNWIRNLELNTIQRWQNGTISIKWMMLGSLWSFDDVSKEISDMEFDLIETHSGIPREVIAKTDFRLFSSLVFLFLSLFKN